MAAIDTNVLIRLLTQDDPVLTRKAETYLANHAPLWISAPVLVESHYVLSRLYAWPKPALLAMLHSITNSRQFILQDQTAVVAAANQWAASKAGFVDCLNVELAKAHGKDPLATFDKDAARCPGAVRLGA